MLIDDLPIFDLAKISNASTEPLVLDAFETGKRYTPTDKRGSLPDFRKSENPNLAVKKFFLKKVFWDCHLMSVYRLIRTADR